MIQVKAMQRSLTFLLLLSLSTQAFGQKLNEQIFGHAPELIRYMNQKGYRNVGVLKFRVKKPNEPTSDSVGTFNWAVTDRLEAALILSNPNDSKRQVGIIRDASSQAGRIPKANHLNAAGRAKLFSASYAPAWGKGAIRPDAFLTGIVQVHPGFRTATVGILAFGKEGGPLEKAVPTFEANLDASTIGEMGESFMLRGAFDDGTTTLTLAQREERTNHEAVKQAALVKSEQAVFPLADPTCPVDLEVRYGGQRAAVEFRHGRALVREPSQNEEVSFVVRRRGSHRGRYAIVLKVNGENTLYKQRQPALDCTKWILEPERDAITIVGYQSDNQSAEKFRVLSRAESKSKEIYYGRDVGQISITVFQERRGERPAPDLLDEDAEDLLALTRGIFPAQQPKNLFALKHQLRSLARNNNSTRGLIAQGDATKHLVRTVTFDADPTPVVSAVVTYYRP